MKKYIYSLVLTLISLLSFSQALPTNRYHAPYILDHVTGTPSFAYSLRKLSRGYAGYALRMRRGSDNAEAEVRFNNRDIVGIDSEVVVSSSGGSGITVGQVMTFAAFAGTNHLYVSKWYDQGANAYDAVQTNMSLQPQLVLNSAGASNTLPSIVYNGDTYADHLVVNQPIQNLTNNGVNGSFLMVGKGTQNTSQHSFGMRNDSTNWRWSMHINWSDGYCYFDASEVCCAPNRRFYNASSINTYRQYSFVRGTNYKTVRLNSGATALNNSSATSFTQTGGAFYLGSWGTSSAKGFYGNTTEIILFPKDLAITILNTLETDQMNFWL